MFEAKLKLDYSEFDAAFAQFARLSRKSSADLARAQARLFIRDVVSVTPPNKNARLRPKVGAMMVRRDIKRAVRSSRAKNLPTAAEVHSKARDRRGKVNPRTVQQKASGVAAYIKKMQGRVGLLASGWNASALKFGHKMPAWIARHGSRRGAAVQIDKKGSLLIRLTNAVRFAGQVMGMQRRVQWALNNRARQMNKQLEDRALKQAAKRAKFAVA
jgi:hypothetical protein